MTSKTPNVGYEPTRNTGTTVWIGSVTFLTMAVCATAALFVLTPIHPYGQALDLLATWNALGSSVADEQAVLRLVLGIVTGAMGG